MLTNTALIVADLFKKFKEKMMKEFYAGQKVYCPSIGKDVYTLKENVKQLNKVYISLPAYHLDQRVYFYKENGLRKYNDFVPQIFHAIPENHALLEQLYGVKFEAPPALPTSKEVIQKMLDDGWKYVPCFVSDTQDKPNPSNRYAIIHYVTNAFMNYNGERWNYATPFDPKTGKIIIDYVDGEIVTE